MIHPPSFPVPTRSRSLVPERLCLLLSACLTVSACGSGDNGNNTPVGPSGPVALSITGFLNDRGQSFDRDGDSVVLSCDGTISVLFGPRSGSSLRNWALRPPGACESYKQCGYIQLTITPEAGGSPKHAAAASLSVLVPMNPGRQQLDAELFRGDGKPFLQNKAPVEDTLSGVDFVAPSDCAAPSTSSGGTGSGGSASGGSAGATTTEGAGGGAGQAGAAGASGEGGAAGAAQG